MTLVDTSVWIDHLRRGNQGLVEALDEGTVYGHVFVIGELACGHLRKRDQLLSLLDNLPAAPVAGHEEVLTLISERDLAGRGLGWIDMHLLASALLAHSSLWTLDKTLEKVAAELRLT